MQLILKSTEHKFLLEFSLNATIGQEELESSYNIKQEMKHF